MASKQLRKNGEWGDTKHFETHFPVQFKLYYRLLQIHSKKTRRKTEGKIGHIKPL